VAAAPSAQVALKEAMDRFSQLEFGDIKPEQPRQPGEAERGPDYFVKEALRYWLAGDYEVALRNYSRVLEQDSARFEGWSGQIHMLIELGEYREADMWADKAMELFPDHPELLAYKAVANQRDARYEQAVAYSDNSVGRDPTTPRVWLARAEVFLKRKDAVVDGCLGKAVHLAKADRPIVKLEAARLLRQKKNYVAAIGHLNDAMPSLTKAPMLWLELGLCQAALGQGQASASLEQALRLRPHWPEAQAALNRRAGPGFWGRLFGK
jgi:tetratricopeptide (TPR) repeat protein